MRAALYARVSTEDQGKNYSLPTQLEACRRYAQEHGLEVVAEFTDEFTGASLDRPGLDALRDLAAQRGCDAVIVYDVDRLARKMVYQLILEEELKRYGVNIHYVVGQYGDDPESNLHKQIKGAIAEYERTRIAERMSRGRRGKAKAGKVVGNGRPPYGYRFTPDWRLELYEAEAEVVRQIFRWAVYGDSTSGPLTPGGDRP